MNVLPVTSAMHVLRVSIPRVSSSNPDTRRPVAHRHAVAPVIQVSPTSIAVAMLNVKSAVVKRAAGTIRAVARLTATRATISPRCGGAGGEATGIAATVMSWKIAIYGPVSGV